MTRMPKWIVSWNSKLFLLLLAFSLAPTVAVAVWGFETTVSNHEQATLQGFQAIARAKAEAIDHFTEFRRRDVERIATLLASHVSHIQQLEAARRKVKDAPPLEPLPQLKDAEALPKTGEAQPPPKPEAEAAAEAPPPSPEENELEKARTALKQTLGLILWDQKDFEELLVLDPKGRVTASTYDDHEIKTAADLSYFRAGRKATYLEPVFMSPISQELTMVISTPIRDEKLATLGVLAARLNLKRFFRLINDSTGLGETGETVTAKKVEDRVVFMSPTRHDANAALERNIPLGSPKARALQEAARGQSGNGTQTDYRGRATYAAWQYVPSLEWGLVVKMDRSEVLQGLGDARDRTLMITAVVFLLCIAAATITARALVRPLRQLKEATDKISRGDLAVQLDIRSNDEIGELADSFDRMVAAIKFFRERAREGDADDEEDEEAAAAERRRIPEA
jgi:HAMP domain-containing protein